MLKPEKVEEKFGGFKKKSYLCTIKFETVDKKEKKDTELIKHLIKGRIGDLEKQMNILLDNWDKYSEETQFEYQRDYLSKKSAYEDVLWMIKGYLETPIQ